MRLVPIPFSQELPMPFTESSGWCKNCDCQVMIRKETANHLIHALVTLFLCGFWLPFWILVWLSEGPYRCTRCGATVNVPGSSIGKVFIGLLGLTAMVLIGMYCGCFGMLGMFGTSTTTSATKPAGPVAVLGSGKVDDKANGGP